MSLKSLINTRVASILYNLNQPEEEVFPGAFSDANDFLIPRHNKYGTKRKRENTVPNRNLCAKILNKI
jgi:hypothetical protein